MSSPFAIRSFVSPPIFAALELPCVSPAARRTEPLRLFTHCCLTAHIHCIRRTAQTGDSTLTTT